MLLLLLVRVIWTWIWYYSVRRKSPVKVPHSIKQNLTMSSSNSRCFSYKIRSLHWKMSWFLHVFGIKKSMFSSEIKTFPFLDVFYHPFLTFLYCWLSSRLSLVGSRQSLVGSRSQLASPGTERPTTSQSIASFSEKTEKKTNMSPPEYSSSSKRESFVEVHLLN